MTEHYYWWWNGVKRLSRAEIRKMKENMQKTPLVQEKANKYINNQILILNYFYKFSYFDW